MKLHYKLLFLVLCLYSAINAKEKIKYPVVDIPKSLLENAHAVVRENISSTEVIAPTRIVTKRKMAITILKESALDLSYFREYYSSLSKVEEITANVYDASGKRIKRIKLEDIHDQSAISGASLYEDSRVKIIDPKCTSYPFTVEYTFEKRYNNSYQFPSWIFFEGYNVSIQSSEFKIKAPKVFPIAVKEVNLSEKGSSIEEGESIIKTWKIENYKAISHETMAGPITEWAPMIYANPEQFKISGYVGSYNSWKELGDYYYKLIDGQDKLPESTINEVKQLFKDDMTDYDKISCVYRYSQNKNRYISIQEGIGGHKPFDAETVDRLSYGDCKALTNYIMSILNQLGYKSYYTVVDAGDEVPTFDRSFVNDYFNHVFLCVELPKDTLWLECTNQHSPCGYIGGFTDDRDVLVVKENGSKLVHTPSYSAKENNQSFNADIQLDANGNGNAKLNISYSGALYSSAFALTLMDKKDQRDAIVKSISIPNFILDTYELETEHKRKPKLLETLNIQMPDYANKMGKRLLLKANINKQSYVPPYARNRRTPLHIRRNYSENDTTVYHLPEGMMVESLPKNASFETPFGKYQSKAESKDGKLYYYRYLELKKGLFPKEQFNEFRDFLEKISVADDATTILAPQS